MMQRETSSPYALGVTGRRTYERPSGARLPKLESRGGDAIGALRPSDMPVNMYPISTWQITMVFQTELHCFAQIDIMAYD